MGKSSQEQQGLVKVDQRSAIRKSPFRQSEEELHNAGGGTASEAITAVVKLSKKSFQ